MNKKELSSLKKAISKESNSLKNRGQLDGLHEIARQNSFLSQIYIELILSVKALHKWTIILTMVLIVLTIIFGIIPYLNQAYSLILKWVLFVIK
jgi:hypothetical protein